MSYQLAPDVSFCIAVDQIIFHDVRNDAYLSLEKPQSASFLAYASEGRVLDAQLLCELVFADLLVENGSAFRPITAVVSSPVTSSMLDTPSRNIAAIEAIEAIFDQLRVGFALHYQSLERILATLRKVCRPHKFANGQEASILATAVSAFDHSARFIPSSTQCLRRSIALHRFLARRGIRVQLVMGVQVNPFSAHAWLQRGGTVLNDSVENVARYTPIMVM